MKTINKQMSGADIERWFSMEREIADNMAGIYNCYIKLGATYEECARALLASIGMLDLNNREYDLANKLNSEYENDAYYVARALVRLPFDSEYMELAGNTLSKEIGDKLSVLEVLR